MVIGNNQGANHEESLSYAEAEAKQILQVLQHLGELKTEWSYLLLGQRASKARKTFEVVRQRIREIGPKGKVLLFFYYSGHADGRSLHMGRTRLAMAEVRRFVVGSKATVSIAIVDACHSGSLARSKGAWRGPGYDIRTLSADAGAQLKGHVIITSSGPEELSQEADKVRGSYFSHYVLSGLKGAADLSRDGDVTLAELYHFAYSRTLSRTSQTHSGPQHAVREMRLYGTGEVVLTKIDRGHAAIRFPAGLHGTYYVIHKRSGSMRAELKLAGKPSTIALPADTYLIRKRTRTSVLVSQINLSWGGVRLFDPARLRAYPLVKSVPRGPAVDPSPYRGGLSFGVRTGAVPGVGLVPGLGLGLCRHFGWLAVGINGFWGYRTFEAQDTSVDNHEFEGAATAGVLLLTGRFEGTVGIRAGLGYVFQRVANAPDHGSFGGQFEAVATLAYLLRDPVFVSGEVGLGAGLFDAASGGTRARPLVHLGVGVGSQF